VLARLALPAVLVIAAALRLWRLGQNGFGNEYYTAGVRSMSQGWRNFLYHAFDPGGFVSVDKPPLAAWVQVASVKLLGFHGWSVLLPQVLEGVAAVWLVARLVERPFGRGAGVLAGLFLALTPVSVAVDRSSNTESCLVLVLLLAAAALLRAAREDHRGWLLVSATLIGVAFNVKMLAAFVVLPAFALTYLLATPFAWRRRLVDGALAAVVLAAVSLSWIVVYDLTPAHRRPYAGTTDTNSMLELAVGPYGIGRFVRQVRPAVAAGAETETGRRDQSRRAASAERAAADGGPRTGFARAFVRAPLGPLRLADGQLAGQVGWLLPLAAVGLVTTATREPWRRPLPLQHVSLVLWVAWAATYALVYSWAGGIFHFYYMSTLASPLAALAAVGVTSLWRGYVGGGWRRALLPAALLLTAAWQLRVDVHALGGIGDLAADVAALKTGSLSWRGWLHVALFSGTLLATLTLFAVAVWPRVPGAVAAAAIVVGVAASLALPVAWSLSSVLVPGPGVLPSADLGRLLPEYSDARARRILDADGLSRLIAFLRANRRDERYLLSTSSAALAAPIIVQTGEPVMARGGFHGLDPILTADTLAKMVESGQLRFAMLNDLSLVSRRLGGEIAGQPIADWVRAHGRPVDPSLWRGSRRGAMSLYDLRPDLGLAHSGA
jgi:4-amino-4-deoxy-L-arabinose transferase-like glycosyltransferase